MRAFLMMICLLSILTSCELHEQEASVKRESDTQTFDLSVVDEMFVAIADDEYFKLKDLIKEYDGLINVPNNQGQLLLIEAVKAERKFITHLLVVNGADINLRDSENISTLDFVSRINNEEHESWTNIINGEDLSQNDLNKLAIRLVSETSYVNQDKTIKRLNLYFELGVDVNEQIGRYTILMTVAPMGLDQLVRFLCQREDIDVNKKIGGRSAYSLVKRQMRRNPKLKTTLDILIEFGAS